MTNLQNQIAEKLGLLHRNGAWICDDTKFRLRGGFIEYSADYSKYSKLVAIRPEDLNAVVDAIRNDSRISTSEDVVKITRTYAHAQNPISGDGLFATISTWRREIQCGLYEDAKECVYITDKKDIKTLYDMIIHIIWELKELNK